MTHVHHFEYFQGANVSTLAGNMATALQWLYLSRFKAHLHDTTSRIRFLSWRMKTIADATIPVYPFMAKFEM